MQVSHRVQRQAEFAPAIEAPSQRADTGDSVRFESQRHTGARGFAWSTAVQHDVAIARYLLVAGFELLGREAHSAGQNGALRLDVGWVA